MRKGTFPGILEKSVFAGIFLMNSELIDIFRIIEETLV